MGANEDVDSTSRRRWTTVENILARAEEAVKRRAEGEAAGLRIHPQPRAQSHPICSPRSLSRSHSASSSARYATLSLLSRSSSAAHPLRYSNVQGALCPVRSQGLENQYWTQGGTAPSALPFFTVRGDPTFSLVPA
ncbi:Hypothetical protein NTJ_13419 [Nesidiocoris tenuis]|uniref:Uncharacterized protein n=1 Tax=Nesidiocoris tenuis TaxID=355587 RepID=A0ABN7B893_9HEMI|nr:Hypothetical protein NTJ_13419 [Nesidiocoris tenuis]